MTMGMRMAVAAGLTALAGTPVALGQTYTMSDGAASFMLAGPFDSNLPNTNATFDGTPVIGGSDRLSVIGWSYRSPLDAKTYLMSALLTPTVTQPAANQLVFSWPSNGLGMSGVARFNATLTLTLRAGPVSGSGTIEQSMVFQAMPTNATTQTFELLNLVDLDFPPSVTTNAAAITASGGALRDTATYTVPGSAETGVVRFTPCHRYQAGPGFALRQLMSQSVGDLNDTASYTGDSGTAFAWVLTLGPGQSRTITSTVSINMPAGCAADCDGSGGLTPADFTCVLGKYRSGDTQADCDGSGGLTPADFTCFLAKYRAGCN